MTLDALRPFLVAPPVQHPPPAAYLSAARSWALDIALDVRINGNVVSRTAFRDVYWTFAQQLAHMTANGATTRTGDLFASGTVSGDTEGSYGSMMELTWGGTRMLHLDDGSARTFLEDGDTVALHGCCGGDAGMPRIGFGDATGTIVPRRSA